MTSAIGRTEEFSLRKVSKEIKQMDRRVQHARQLFNERIARAQSEYHDALRRAVMGDVETETVTPATTRSRTAEQEATATAAPAS